MQLSKQEKSIWREAYSGSLYPNLANNIETDVVVVGAGITGLTSAYLLKQAGFKVVVLDKSTVGGGTTGRTTGKVTSQHGLIYADLQKNQGPNAARIYGQANQAAIEQIENIINSEKIDCEWQRQDNYVFTANPDKVSKFKQEAQVATELGLPASFVTKTPLPFAVQAAVKFTNQAQIHSQKYLLGLAAAIDGNGSYVFENSNVTSTKDGNPGHIKASKNTVTAKHIIIATNVPTLPLMARGGYCLLEYPTESYIVAGKLDKPLTDMYISPDKQHYSILPVTIDGQPSLLIGGNNHLSGLRGSRQARFQKLADYANKNFGINTITNHWSDRDYLSYDDIPLVGKLYPWSKNLYVGTGFMKWGLSNGTVAGMILCDTISGKQNPWSDTFSSARLKPISSIPRAVSKYLARNH